MPQEQIMVKVEIFSLLGKKGAMYIQHTASATTNFTTITTAEAKGIKVRLPKSI